MSSTLKTMGITSSSTTRKTTQSLSQCLVKHQSIDDDIGHVVDRDTQVLANTIKTVHSATIGGDKMTKPTNFAHSILNTSSSSSSYQRASTLPLNRQKHERSTTTTITPPPTPTITTLPCSTSSNRNQITSTSAVTCTTENCLPKFDCLKSSFSSSSSELIANDDHVDPMIPNIDDLNSEVFAPNDNSIGLTMPLPPSVVISDHSRDDQVVIHHHLSDDDQYCGRQDLFGVI
ncbi:hypothetical protein RDWZM_009726 [Blomia tropicalis]|uniref:Uncharacterized protein n=1 Tax=Blomia tropicalis TaxID=40697 RepID=A0A9Q0M476_BLOTA|nr:hypothetical protein RDWZM_009726 [Blomia tropicalis]